MSVPSRLYKFNETNTSTIGNDESGGSADLTNLNVISVVDEEYSNVASFDGSAYFTLPSASVPASMSGGSSRMVTFWIKLNNLSEVQYIFSMGNATASGKRFTAVVLTSGVVQVRFFNIIAASTTVLLVPDVWYNISVGFDTSDNRVKIYVDGVLEVDVGRSVNTATTDFVIGANVEGLTVQLLDGFLADMRIYDDVIDATEALLIYNTGPETFTILATLYTHVVDLTWRTVSGATTYTITQKEDAGSDVTIVDSSADFAITLGGITPGSSYEYNIYTDLDLVTPEETITKVAPIVDSSSVQLLLTRFLNDLTDISEISTTALSEIDSVLREVLSTGDTVETEIGETTFVEDTGSITIPLTGLSVLTPFIQSVGAGQTATMILDDDASSNVITYDDTVDEVVFEATNYAVGTYMIIGGYKVKVNSINT